MICFFKQYFLILDCSADITVLRKDRNQVIEKYRTKGNDCGGASVNESFLDVICQIVGLQVFTELRKEYFYSYLELEREFEFVKRNVKEKQKSAIFMTVPYITLHCLCERYLASDVLKVFSSSIYSNAIVLVGAKMRINTDIFHNFFKPTIDKIIKLIKNVFANYKDSHNVQDIVMVGGFAECWFVQDAVRQTFSNRNLIISTESGLAVLKGAVFCGHQPNQYLRISSSEVR